MPSSGPASQRAPVGLPARVTLRFRDLEDEVGRAAILKQFLAVFDAAGIDMDTEVSLETQGQSVLITPTTQAHSIDRECHFEAALEEANRRFSRTFQRLAE